MTKKIQIGKIINTHGIKGELKVMPLTDDPRRFDDLESVYIEGSSKAFTIEKVWYNKGLIMLKFKDYNNINDVLVYKNHHILIDENDAVKLPEHTYFIYEIIGLEVYDTDNNHLGKIHDVLQPGANDVYVVRKEGRKKDYLIPALKNIVVEVDIEICKMIIDPIEGLIE